MTVSIQSAPAWTLSARDLRAALLAGLAGAVVEMVFVLPIQGALGNSPAVVFQSIAAGALGRAAFTGGVAAVALGVAVHLLVSLAAALVYVEAALRWPRLDRRPILGGIAFGAAVYMFMVFGVIPLSAIGFHPPRSLPLMGLSIAVHLFAFGLPIALVSTWLRRGVRSGATTGRDFRA